MWCCAICFGDSFLRDQIAQGSNTIGKCDYCGSTNVPLVKPEVLRDHFELLIGIYHLNSKGKFLVDLFKSDWELFNILDNAHAKELLAEIIDDGEIVRQRFLPVEPECHSSLNSWRELRNELIHKNRFFPLTTIDLNRLKRLIGYLSINFAFIQHPLFRARIQEGSQPYTHGVMGMPPPDKSTDGRANPAGIPYLYLASDIGTAISEIRPHTGENVCVIEYLMHGNPQIVDLCNPRATISPFFIGDEEEISIVRREIEFLIELGKELSRPVLPKTAHLEYLPSQYICEFIKSCGFNGVKYGSSVGSGFNIALFDATFAEQSTISVHYVSRVNIDYEIR